MQRRASEAVVTAEVAFGYMEIREGRVEEHKRTTMSRADRGGLHKRLCATVEWSGPADTTRDRVLPSESR